MANGKKGGKRKGGRKKKKVVAEIEDVDSQSGGSAAAAKSGKGSSSPSTPSNVNINFVHRHSSSSSSSNVLVEEHGGEGENGEEEEAPLNGDVGHGGTAAPARTLEKIEFASEDESDVVVAEEEEEEEEEERVEDKEKEKEEEEEKLGFFGTSVAETTHTDKTASNALDVEQLVAEEDSGQSDARLQEEMDAMRTEHAAQMKALQDRLTESERAQRSSEQKCTELEQSLASGEKQIATLEYELKSRDEQMETLQREMASHSQNAGVEKESVNERLAQLERIITERDKEIAKLNDLLEQEKGFSFSFKMEIEELKKQLANSEHELGVLQNKLVFPLGAPNGAADDGNNNNNAETSEKIDADRGTSKSLDKRTGIVEQLEAHVRQLEAQVGEQARDFGKQIELLRGMLSKEEKYHEQTRETADKTKKKLNDQIHKLQQSRDQLSAKIDTIKRDMDLERNGAQDETERLRQTNTELLRKFYWHALLSVKLKLQKNFSMAEMVDLAVSEQVSEENLNNWIATKLGL